MKHNLIKNLRRDKAVDKLIANHYNFKQFNQDLHIVIYDANGMELVNFWPTTGVWWAASNRKRGRSLESLISFIDIYGGYLDSGY